MAIYKSITEAIESIPYGFCNWCESKHEFNNIKCELDPTLKEIKQ